MEVERVAVEIGLEVYFGREAAARAAERLPLLPPLWNGPPLSSTLIGLGNRRAT